MYMKTIFLFLAGCITAISVSAQSVSNVTINVRGNNNEAIVIDNTEYVVYNDYATNPRADETAHGPTVL